MHNVQSKTAKTNKQTNKQTKKQLNFDVSLTVLAPFSEIIKDEFNDMLYDFSSIYLFIAKYLSTGSFKNRSIDI